MPKGASNATHNSSLVISKPLCATINKVRNTTFSVQYNHTDQCIKVDARIMMGTCISTACLDVQREPIPDDQCKCVQIYSVISMKTPGGCDYPIKYPSYCSATITET